MNVAASVEVREPGDPEPVRDDGGSRASTGGRSPLDRRLIAAVATAAALVFMAALFRQAGVPKVQTIWAEDGAIFLDCAYRRSLFDCLTTPYAGYLHLVPRLGAWIAALGPPAQASLAVTLLAAMAAAAASALAARAVGVATGSALAGFVGAAGLGLVWQAGREVLGNLANAHWVLLAAAVIILVGAWVDGRFDGFDVGLVAFAGLSSALAPVLAVLAIPSVARGRPGARAVLAVATVVAIVQVATYLGAPRQPAGPVPLGPADVVGGLQGLVVGNGFFGNLRTPPGWAIPAGLMAVAPLAIWAAGSNWRSVVPGLGAVATLVVVGLLVFATSVVFNRALNPRYAYIPTTLWVAALVIGSTLPARNLAARRGAGPLRRNLALVLLPAVGVLLAVGFVRSFRLEARASGGPDVPAELEASAARCGPGTDRVRVPISPRPATDEWTLALPCGRLVR